MGNGYTTTLQLEVFTQRNLVAACIRFKNNKKLLFEPPFGGLGVMCGLIYSSLESSWL